MATNNIELINRIGAEQVRSAYSNTAPGMSSTLVGALLIAGILGGSSWWMLSSERFDMQLLFMLYLCAVASGADAVAHRVDDRARRLDALGDGAHHSASHTCSIT